MSEIKPAAWLVPSRCEAGRYECSRCFSTMNAVNILPGGFTQIPPVCVSCGSQINGILQNLVVLRPEEYSVADDAVSSSETH